MTKVMHKNDDNFGIAMREKLTCKDCPFAVHIRGKTYQCTGEHHNDRVTANTKATKQCYKELYAAFNPEKNSYDWHFINNENYLWKLKTNSQAILRWHIDTMIQRINHAVRNFDLTIYQSKSKPTLLKVYDKKLKNNIFDYYWKTKKIKAGETEKKLENPEKEIIAICIKYRRYPDT